MIGWLIYDEAGAKRNMDYIRMHQELAKEFHINLRFRYDYEVAPLLEQKTEYPDFCFMRTINPSLSKQMEHCGISVFNSSFVSEVCNDKGKTLQYIEKNTHVPVIPTTCFSCHELSKELLIENGDSVIKAVDGHGGNEVFLTSDSYNRIKETIGASNFIIQPYIRGMKKDVRVYVIGRKIMGAVERTAKNGFKSNFSLGGMVKPYSLSTTEKDMVNQICDVFSFGMVGIDFLVNEKGKWLLNEIEDVVGARMYYKCYPETNLLREYFSYVMENI